MTKHEVAVSGDLQRILDVQPYDETLYYDIDLNRLALFGIDWLKQSRIPISRERLTVVLFRLFPAKFSMAEFPMFPDPVRTQRAELQLRPKYRNWAEGSLNEGNLTLTQTGLHALEQVKGLLARTASEVQDEAGKRSVLVPRDVSEKWISAIEQSALFKSYKERDLNEDSIWDFYDLLHASENTDRKVLRANFSKLQSYADGLQRDDIQEFLRWVREHFRDRW